jgi:hypothetical protein
MENSEQLSTGLLEEPLRLQADWFRRQGRLQDDKLETIIEELKNEE